MLRRWGRLLLLAIVMGAVVWWFTHGKPSAQQMVDDLARPLFGSPAAVQESERNRVEGQAVVAITDQVSETPIVALRVGMTFREVRAVLGEPNDIETPPLEKGKPESVRWTYRSAHRFLVFEDGRLVSIAIR
ncbi:MAG TPA: hypothetical protein VGS00_08525 [Thermoanaerobaculia bacterium]|nr:hypothetical protein [Thermoanaerobaculia bacterium]